MVEHNPYLDPVRAIVRRGFLGRVIFHQGHAVPGGQFIIDFENPSKVISPRLSPNVVQALSKFNVRHLQLQYTDRAERLMAIPLDNSTMPIWELPAYDLRVRTYGYIGLGTIPYPQDEVPILDTYLDPRNEDRLRIAITHQHIDKD